MGEISYKTCKLEEKSKHVTVKELDSRRRRKDLQSETDRISGKDDREKKKKAREKERRDNKGMT